MSGGRGGKHPQKTHINSTRDTFELMPVLGSLVLDVVVVVVVVLHLQNRERHELLREGSN